MDSPQFPRVFFFWLTHANLFVCSPVKMNAAIQWRQWYRVAIIVSLAHNGDDSASPLSDSLGFGRSESNGWWKSCACIWHSSNINTPGSWRLHHFNLFHRSSNSVRTTFLVCTIFFWHNVTMTGEQKVKGRNVPARDRLKVEEKTRKFGIMTGFWWWCCITLMLLCWMVMRAVLCQASHYEIASPLFISWCLTRPRGVIASLVLKRNLFKWTSVWTSAEKEKKRTSKEKIML